MFTNCLASGENEITDGGNNMNNGFFSYDGPFFTVMNRLSDIVILNVLWIICCIPIVTVGASTTALLYVTMKILRGEDAYIVKYFFRSFKENFLQSTVIWLIMLAIGVLLVFNFLFLPNMNVNLSNIIYNMFFSATCLTTLIYSMILMYVFPLQARLENKIRHTFKNALLLSFRHLATTILLILIVYGSIFLAWKYYVKLFFIVVLFAGSGIAMLCSMLYNRMFDIYIKPKDLKEEEDPEVITEVEHKIEE